LSKASRKRVAGDALKTVVHSITDEVAGVHAHGLRMARGVVKDIEKDIAGAAAEWVEGQSSDSPFTARQYLSLWRAIGGEDAQWQIRLRRVILDALSEGAGRASKLAAKHIVQEVHAQHTGLSVDVKKAVAHVHGQMIKRARLAAKRQVEIIRRDIKRRLRASVLHGDTIGQMMERMSK
jgi:hypothetical protein